MALYKVNNFRNQQKVWTCDTETGIIMTGIISDKFCHRTYKFEKKPVHLRTHIPVIWNDNTCDVIPFRQLKAVIQ